MTKGLLRPLAVLRQGASLTLIVRGQLFSMSEMGKQAQRAMGAARTVQGPQAQLPDFLFLSSREHNQGGWERVASMGSGLSSRL